MGRKYVLQDDVAEILIDEEQLAVRVRELADAISADYEGKNPLLVCILKGGVIFLADLSRQMSVVHEIDFMAITSYGNATESSGIVRILKDLDTSISRRHVIIVEDIVDTGRTLEYVIRNLETRGPASVRICTLLSKPTRRQIDVPTEYVGFEIPDVFVVGFGLDYAEVYRNLPFIGVLKPEKYREPA